MALNSFGHDPNNPRLELSLPPPVTLPFFLQDAMAAMGTFYRLPRKVLPTLNRVNESDKNTIMRSDRREAAVLMGKAILSKTEMASLRVGVPTADGFMSVTLLYLAKVAGLTTTRQLPDGGEREVPSGRARRAYRDLKKANLFKSVERSEKGTDGTFKGVASIKVVNPDFLRALGLGGRLEAARSDGSARLRKLARKWGINLKQIASTRLALADLVTSKKRPAQGLAPVGQHIGAEDEPPRPRPPDRDEIALMATLSLTHPEKSPRELLQLAREELRR